MDSNFGIIPYKEVESNFGIIPYKEVDSDFGIIAYCLFSMVLLQIPTAVQRMTGIQGFRCAILLTEEEPSEICKS